MILPRTFEYNNTSRVIQAHLSESYTKNGFASVQCVLKRTATRIKTGQRRHTNRKKTRKTTFPLGLDVKSSGKSTAIYAAIVGNCVMVECVCRIFSCVECHGV